MFMALLLTQAAVSGAASISLESFLARSQALENRGAMALFSGDLRRLQAIHEAARVALKSQRLADVAARRRPAYCPREGAIINPDELMSFYRKIPPSARKAMTYQDGLLDYMKSAYPC